VEDLVNLGLCMSYPLKNPLIPFDFLFWKCMKTNHLLLRNQSQIKRGTQAHNPSSSLFPMRRSETEAQQVLAARLKRDAHVAFAVALVGAIKIPEHTERGRGWPHRC
jgi:hypothetical protein